MTFGQLQIRDQLGAASQRGGGGTKIDVTQFSAPNAKNGLYTRASSRSNLGAPV